jgi:hypothetical protein
VERADPDIFGSLGLQTDLLSDHRHEVGGFEDTIAIIREGAGHGREGVRWRTRKRDWTNETTV